MNHAVRVTLRILKWFFLTVACLIGLIIVLIFGPFIVNQFVPSGLAVYKDNETGFEVRIELYQSSPLLMAEYSRVVSIRQDYIFYRLYIYPDWGGADNLNLYIDSGKYILLSGAGGRATMELSNTKMLEKYAKFARTRTYLGVFHFMDHEYRFSPPSETPECIETLSDFDPAKVPRPEITRRRCP